MMWLSVIVSQLGQLAAVAWACWLLHARGYDLWSGVTGVVLAVAMASGEWKSVTRRTSNPEGK